MKTLRLLLALSFASVLFAGFARADNCGTEKKCCECSKDKDGKSCGVDGKCCCGKEKTEKKEEAKS